MLRIRLRRTGKKKQPNYRLVVAEHTSSVYGKYVDLVGHYNPFTKKLVLDKEKVKYWLNKGAKPSNTMAILLKKENLHHPSIVVKKVHIPTKEEIKKYTTKEAQEKTEKEAKKKETEERLEEFKEEVAEKVESAAETVEPVKAETENKVDEPPLAETTG